MAQPTLHTERMTLVPLGDEHFEFEVEVDSDPEVMRYIAGRAGTRPEVKAAHRRRRAAADPVPGLGYWVGLVDGAAIGWWILQPPHGPDQPKVAGMTFVRGFVSAEPYDDPIEGAEQGEVEYEITRPAWAREF